MVAAEAQKRKGGGVGVSFRNFTAKQSPTNHGKLRSYSLITLGEASCWVQVLESQP